MSSGKIIARNVVINWIGHGSNLVVMFFLTPFIIHNLGLVQYGIWQLLTVLTGYMGVLDLGIRASTGRYIMLYLGKGSLEKVDETIRTGLGMYTAIGGFILILGSIIGIFFPLFFPSMPKEYGPVVAMLLPALAVNIWVSAVRTVLSSVLAAYERFDLARGSDLVMLAVKTMGTIVALNWGFGLIGLALAIIICNVVGLIINYFLALRVHSGLRMWPLLYERERISELYRYGIGAFIISVSGKIVGQTDLVLVGNLINLESVGVYAIGAMLIYYSDTFIGQIMLTLFPSLQRVIAKEEMGHARWLFFRQIRLVLAFGLLMYVGYLSFAESFIRLWMYDPIDFPLTSVSSAAQVMAILSVSKIFMLFRSGSHSILSATGHVGFAAKTTMVESFVNLSLSIAFVVIFDLGLAGVAMGSIVAHIFTSTAILPWYACKKIGIHFYRYLYEVGGRGVIVFITFSLFCHYLKITLPTNDWLEFSILVILATIGYIPLMVIFLVPVEYRKSFGLKLRGLFAKA